MDRMVVLVAVQLAASSGLTSALGKGY